MIYFCSDSAFTSRTKSCRIGLHIYGMPPVNTLNRHNFPNIPCEGQCKTNSDKKNKKTKKSMGNPQYTFSLLCTFILLESILLLIVSNIPHGFIG